MRAPAPLSAAELQLLAAAVLERVELVALTAELGGCAPASRPVASVIASALELHRELARTLDDGLGQDDADVVAAVSDTMERINDALAAIERSAGARPASPVAR